MIAERTLDELLEAIVGVRSILDHGRWANGELISAGDRAMLRYHLELLRRDRDQVRRRARPALGRAS